MTPEQMGVAGAALIFVCGIASYLIRRRSNNEDDHPSLPNIDKLLDVDKKLHKKQTERTEKKLDTKLKVISDISEETDQDKRLQDLVDLTNKGSR